MKRCVAVLGGGITGLSACHWIEKFSQEAIASTNSPNRLETLIIEKRDHPGGWIQSYRRPPWHFEQGPRSLRVSQKALPLLTLICDLHLENEIVLADNAAKQRYIYMNGKVRKVPRNIFHILRNPIAIKAMPSIFRELFVQRRPTSIEDESVKDFFLRHFGSYVTDKFVAPLVVGIYGGNISKLSAQMCFNSLWQLDQKNGSLLRGFFVRSVFKSLREFDDMGQQSAVSLLKNIRSKGGIFSFTRGLQMLTDALASHYRANLRLSSNVVQLRTNDHRQLEVVIEKNEPDGSSHLETLVADYAISCLPANELAFVLRSAHPEISELLIKIPFVSIAVVSLGYSENVIPSSLKGFGYLVPPSERQEILGVTFDSEVFPSLFRSSLVSPSTITVMLGGDLDNHDRVIDVTKTSEKELLDISLRYVRQHLGITKTPVCIQIKVCKEAIPQYTVGHTQRLNAIKKLLQHQLPQLYLAGNSYDGVGVGDCVMSASVAAKNIVNSFFEHQK